MNRLDIERERLFGAASPEPDRVRCAVLGLRGTAGWAALGELWRGVQQTLELPAPAIALDGRDGGQLWFSLAQPVPVHEAAAFLAGLRARWLAGLPAHQVQVWPASEATDAARPAAPPVAVAPERWSAFVAPDLAALFADESWLDHEPGTDAQAELLARLTPIAPADWARALQALAPTGTTGTTAVQPAPPSPAAAASPAGGNSPHACAVPPESDLNTIARQGDPHAFLQAVMRDASVPLALRIEAARALLPR